MAKTGAGRRVRPGDRLGHRHHRGAGRRLRPGGAAALRRRAGVRPAQPAAGVGRAGPGGGLRAVDGRPAGGRRAGPPGGGSASGASGSAPSCTRSSRRAPAARPWAPRIIWADNRSVAEAEAIKRETDALALYRRTGCPVHPMYLPPKLRWLRAQPAGGASPAWRRWGDQGVRPARAGRGSPSSTAPWPAAAASTTSAAGPGTTRPCALAGIAPRQLPALVEPAAPLPVPPERLREAGLPGGLRPRPGGRRRRAADDRHRLRRPRADGGHGGHQRGDPGGGGRPAHGRAGAHLVLLPGRRALGGRRGDQQRRAGLRLAARPAGRRRRARDRPGAAQRPGPRRSVPGADGLLFLPYLAGERSPNWNANARGVLFGLSLAHDYRHLVRATLEGVAYRMRTIFEPMEEVAGRAEEMRVAGGLRQLAPLAPDRGRRPGPAPDPGGVARSLGPRRGAAGAAGLRAGRSDFEDLAPMADAGEVGATRTAPGQAALRPPLYEAYQRIYAAGQSGVRRRSPRLQAELGQSEKRAARPAGPAPGRRSRAG